MAEPVAITGLGLVSGLGLGVAANWPAMLAGRIAIGEFGLFPTARHRTRLAAQVPDDPRLAPAPHQSRADAFALTAAAEAFVQSGLGSLHDAGVFFGTSTAGMWETERYYAHLGTRSSRRRQRALAAQQNNAPGDAVARHFGVHGPVASVSSACVSGAQALAAAREAILAGECDVTLAGGADGLCELTYAGFNALRAVDPRPSSPFRTLRQGLSLGEGAGVLVLESAAHAQARGAEVLGWFCGAGSTCDAHHMSAPEPAGEGARRAILQALHDAGSGPDEVDFVNAHGTGTPLNDAAEAHALAAALSGRRVPLTSTKSLVGHLLGAAGALEAVVSVLCLRTGLVHPTAGEGPVEPGVDLVVGAPRKLARARTALSTNLAFGGANSALLFRSTGP